DSTTGDDQSAFANSRSASSTATHERNSSIGSDMDFVESLGLTTRHGRGAICIAIAGFHLGVANEQRNTCCARENAFRVVEWRRVSPRLRTATHQQPDFFARAGFVEKHRAVDATLRAACGRPKNCD